MRKRKLKGECHFGSCKSVASYGFQYRVSKTIQSEKYCRVHAYQIRENNVFPKCKLIRLKYADIKVPDPIMIAIDKLPEEKQREELKRLLIE